MNIVLMISGKQGSGKTTLAKSVGLWALNCRQDFFVYPLKFADPLYEMHHSIKEIMRSVGEPIEGTDGTLLQMLGDWGRARRQTLFVDILRRRVEQIVERSIVDNTNRLILIDNARFENEIDCVKNSLDTRVIRVRLEASEHVRQVRAEKWRPAVGHKSEVGLDNYSFFDKIIFTDSLSAHDTTEATTKLIEERLLWKPS